MKTNLESSTIGPLWHLIIIIDIFVVTLDRYLIQKNVTSEENQFHRFIAPHCCSAMGARITTLQSLSYFEKHNLLVLS
jgi:hypothetical protein